MSIPNGTSYKPDALSSGGATQSPLKEDIGPKTGSIVPTLLRLAMRRMTGFGSGAIHGGKAPSAVKNAMSMGSQGKIK
jgi:hypothetical protein